MEKGFVGSGQGLGTNCDWMLFLTSPGVLTQTIDLMCTWLAL